MGETIELNQTATCVEHILAHTGAAVILAAPLGLGKPNALINALYRRIAADADLTLTMHTALSLALPSAAGDLQQRFLRPFLDRHFGADYESLDHVAAMRADRLPANIRVHEFYLQSGAMLHSACAQQDYTSLNYTQVARRLAEAGINVVVQLVARRGDRISLSCNPDVTLDLLDRIHEAGGRRPLLVGVVNDQLPFLGGDADVPVQLFDVLVDDAGKPQRLFAIPREDVDEVEHAIGLHASTLVRDGGTLQIGIGALSDALVHALLLRHRRSGEYAAAIASLNEDAAASAASAACGGLDPFVVGLNGSSEMVMDGFMHLRDAGILVRCVYEDAPLQQAIDASLIASTLRPGDAQRLFAVHMLPRRVDAAECARLVRLGLLPTDTRCDGDEVALGDGRRFGSDLDDADNLAKLDVIMSGRALRGGTWLQGGFVLGSTRLYEWLHALAGEDHAGLSMQRISSINELTRGAEALGRIQRRDARFFNTCMIATALGAAASDALADGRLVSGVGGQYNFVALSHALDDARSILMLRATRNENSGVVSNIRWNYGHTTIPRHLRDIFVTEYGIADLRGRTDQECVIAMLSIADGRFVDDLVTAAQQAKKLPGDFQVPQRWRRNTPDGVRQRLAEAKRAGSLPDYPFGSDFDAIERRLMPALLWLRAHSSHPAGWPALAWAILTPRGTHADALARMGLAAPRGWRESLLSRLLRAALDATS